jgi:hypothetical protein
MKQRTRLVAMEALVALSCLASNGHTIIKIFKIDHQVTRNLLTLIASCYHRYTIVKPITTRQTSREAYFVGLYRRDQVTTQINILKRAVSQWDETYPCRWIKPNSQVEAYLDKIVSQEDEVSQLARQRFNIFIDQMNDDYAKTKQISSLNDHVLAYLDKHPSPAKLDVVRLASLLGVGVD